MGSELGSGEWGVGSGEWGGGFVDHNTTVVYFLFPTPHSPLPSFLHSQKPKCFRSVIIVVARRLPGDAFAVGRRALEAIEIDAQLLAGLRLSSVNLVNGDAHLAVPDFLVRRDVGLHFKARIPFPIVVGRVGAAVNIQVNPFAVRRDLKFGVAFDVLEIATDED